MADLTMCMTKDCELEQLCYRKLAKPSNNQSYAKFSGGEDCVHFWDIRIQKVDIKVISQLQPENKTSLV